MPYHGPNDACMQRLHALVTPKLDLDLVNDTILDPWYSAHAYTYTLLLSTHRLPFVSTMAIVSFYVQLLTGSTTATASG